MATKKKLLQAAAGQAGGAGLNVEDVFSTYLYDGNGGSKTITNNIDLSGEGGMVWIKQRPQAGNHFLFDTERGVNKYLRSNLTSAETTLADTLTSFNSDGFTVGQYQSESGIATASWTFRKAPKFFDVVTYTGDNSANRQIAHNLGQKPGMIIIKSTDLARDWQVYHRSLNTTSGEHLELNQTAAVQTTTNVFNSTEPTDTHFTVGGNITVNGDTYGYVAYLFAHNDGDGEFGPDGDADIIKCGSYTHSGSAWTEDLGFEPQFVISKNTTSTGSWQIVDNMRGLLADDGSGTAYARLLKAEVSNAENNASGINITSTGLEGDGTGGGGSGTYIYIAIRRGPMATPTDANDVFAMDNQNSTEPYWTSGFPVDFQFMKRTGSTDSWYTSSRLTKGKELSLNSNAAEAGGAMYEFDYQDGWGASSYASDVNSWMWRRAPSFFDSIAYTGTGANRTLYHNLGVTPEMIITKQRNGTRDWAVVFSDYNSGLGYFKLNDDSPIAASSYNVHPNRGATSYECNGDGLTNQSGYNYIAYLFATLDGVSKVGSVSFTNGTATNVDCGFSSGARFVMLKSTSVTGGWWMFDTLRGIVSGNDPYLQLNTTTSQNSSFDIIDPLSSGFQLTGNYLSTDTYVFYAIA